MVRICKPSAQSKSIRPPARGTVVRPRSGGINLGIGKTSGPSVVDSIAIARNIPFLKQLKPDTKGVVRVNDGSIRWAFTVMPDHKYHDAIVNGHVFYKRIDGRIEIVINGTSGEEVVDSINIDEAGRLINPVTRENIIVRRKGIERTVIFSTDPRSGRANIYMGDIFPGITTLIKSSTTAKPVFYYSSMAFTIPHDDNAVHHDDLSENRLIFEANRYGIKAYRLSKEKPNERNLIGEAQFDRYGYILLPDGTRYKQNNQEINIFDGKQFRISLGILIPEFGLQHVPVHLVPHVVNGKEYFQAEVRIAGVRFSFSLDKKSALRDDIMSGKVYLRIGRRKSIDVIIASDGGSFRKIGSFRYTSEGVILNQYGTPFKINNQVVQFDKTRVAETTVKIEDLVPECNLLSGTIIYNKTENRAHFQLNGIDYVFPRHPHSIYRKAVEAGRIRYRCRGNKLSIIIIRKDGTEKSIGTIYLSQSGIPEGFPANQRSANIGDYVPAAKIVKIKIKPWLENRSDDRRPRLVFVAQYDGFHFKIEMSHPSLLYKEDFKQGRLYLRISGSEISVIKKPLVGNEFVLCRMTVPDTRPKYTSLNPLSHELKYKHRDEAEKAYRKALANSKQTGNEEDTLNNLRKLADLCPDDPALLDELRSMEIFRQNANQSSGTPTSISDLKRALTSGKLDGLIESGATQLKTVSRLFRIIDSDNNRTIVGNAIYVIGNVGEKLKEPKTHKAEQKHILAHISRHLASLSRDPKMTPYLDLLRVAFERCALVA